MRRGKNWEHFLLLAPGSKIAIYGSGQCRHFIRVQSTYVKLSSSCMKCVQCRFMNMLWLFVNICWVIILLTKVSNLNLCNTKHVIMKPDISGFMNMCMLHCWMQVNDSCDRMKRCTMLDMCAVFSCIYLYFYLYLYIIELWLCSWILLCEGGEWRFMSLLLGIP